MRSECPQCEEALDYQILRGGGAEELIYECWSCGWSMRVTVVESDSEA